MKIRGSGNWTYGKHRSDNGRMGRGENALTAKESKSWKKIMERIDAIFARAERGSDTMKDNRQALHLPLKARMF